LLFDGGSAPLATFGPKLSALAARELKKLGVELHMGCLVSDVDLDSVQVKDHDGNVTRHEVGTILWTAGVQAPPLAHMVAKATGAEQDRAAACCAARTFPCRTIRPTPPREANANVNLRDRGHK
jgi:NADH dehydrogenase